MHLKTQAVIQLGAVCDILVQGQTQPALPRTALLPAADAARPAFCPLKGACYGLFPTHIELYFLLQLCLWCSTHQDGVIERSRGRGHLALLPSWVLALESL